MAELWPFIQLPVRHYILEGKNFTFGWFLCNLAFDEWFRQLLHWNGNFMVSNNI